MIGNPNISRSIYTTDFMKYPGWLTASITGDCLHMSDPGAQDRSLFNQVQAVA